MSRRIGELVRSRLLVVVVLVLVLGGSAVAAVKLPKNSVGTNQLKNGSVTSGKIKNGAVTGAKINLSTLGAVPLAQNTQKLAGQLPSAFQLRVSGICPAGRSIVAIAADGSVSCAANGGPPSGAAGGALSGAYPNPSLNVSGGPCPAGQFLMNLSSLAALTCGPSGSNAALGQNALASITTGTGNTAIGQNALPGGRDVSDNTAVGQSALQADTSDPPTFNFGDNNTAVGQGALENNTLGRGNAAFGRLGLAANTSGQNNTGVGDLALRAADASNNTALGDQAGDLLTTGGNNIDIGNPGSAADASKIKIGIQGSQTSTLIAGINGASITGPTNLALTNGSGLVGTGTTGAVSLPPAVDGATSSSGVPLLINSSGTLGTSTSSRRFKTDIQRIGAQTERALMALRPVSFHYKRQYIKGQPDPLEYGLIAEEVAKIDPNLVAYGNDRKPYTVRYQELPVLLLAEIQSQQQQIDTQQREIDWLMSHARAR